MWGEDSRKHVINDKMPFPLILHLKHPMLSDKWACWFIKKKKKTSTKAVSSVVAPSAASLLLRTDIRDLGWPQAIKAGTIL